MGVGTGTGVVIGTLVAVVVGVRTTDVEGNWEGVAVGDGVGAVLVP